MIIKLIKFFLKNIYLFLLIACSVFILCYGIWNIFNSCKGSWSEKFSYLPRASSSSEEIQGKKVIKESYGEKECRRVLEKIFDKPFPKCRPNFLQNSVTGGTYNLELDCFNKELRLAVEYDGIAHYKYTPYFHKNMEAFHCQKYRDEMKNRLCKENQVVLIRVPYTVKVDDIERYLTKELLKVKVK
jgi:hypothetical protein